MSHRLTIGARHALLLTLLTGMVCLLPTPPTVEPKTLRLRARFLHLEGARS